MRSNLLDIITIVIIIFLIINLNRVLGFILSTSVPLAVVSSSSMEPILHVGDLLITEGFKEYNVGDIVVYKRGGEYIVHRIIRIENFNGSTRYVTKGDANSSPDFPPVDKSDVEGKVVLIIPYLGGLSLILRKAGLKLPPYLILLFPLLTLLGAVLSYGRLRHKGI